MWMGTHARINYLHYYQTNNIMVLNGRLFGRGCKSASVSTSVDADMDTQTHIHAVTIDPAIISLW